MSNYHIDDIFRENLRDFEVTPSSSVWSNIDLPAPIPFYRKPLFITSTVVGIILLIGATLFINQQKQTSSDSTIPQIAQENNVTAYIPYIVPTPFAPEYYLSSKDNSSLSSESQTNSTNTRLNELQAHTSDLATSSSRGSDVHFSEENPSIAHTQSFKDDSRNSSLYRHVSVLESKPVNTPFYIISSRLLRGTNTTNLNETILPYLSHYGLSTPLFSGFNSFEAVSPDETTIDSDSENVDVIPSLPIALLEEEEVDVNDINDDSSFASTDKEGIMARYNEQLDMTKGFHIGGFTSAHNNWILNPALKETVTQNRDLIHQLDFGYTYGVAMGYEFSNKWGLQLEWIVNSEQGQRFAKHARFLSSSSKTNTDINLTYTYFPVLLKYRNQRMFSLTKQPLVVNYIAGIQYGMLKSAEINIENPIVQDDLLQLSSWGFVWGLDYDFYLSKNYFLTFGARTSLSTSSNSRYKPVFPTTNTSNSLLIGLRASFNYQFD